MDFTQSAVPAVGAVIPDRSEATCLTYHHDGKRLFVAHEEGSRLQVIDCVNGKTDRSLRCERETLSCVEATHHDECVLLAGKGSPTQPASQRSAISYWSLYDNKILRKFRGHTDQVTHLSMCPADDTFLSSSLDGTVRLWTVQSAACIAELKLPNDKTEKNPIAAFDSTGLVFAVTASMTAGQGHYMHLYDARNYGGGAFAELKITEADLAKAIETHMNTSASQASAMSKADWTSLDFSKSGSQILVGTANGMSIVLDGFEGTVQRVFASNSQRPAVSCFSSDDKALLMGNEDGSVTCYDLHTGAMLKRLEGHPGPVRCLASNPKYAQFASACTQTALWTW